MTHRTRIVVLTALFAALLPALAGAAVPRKTLIVWPGRFRSTSPSITGYLISEEAIQGPATALVFDAPLELPVGAKLQSAVMSWRGLYWASAQCRIVRKPFTGEKETIASYWVTDNTATNSWAPYNLTFEAVDPVIRKGYRYYIEVDLYHVLSYFGGLKITYTPPVP